MTTTIYNQKPFNLFFSLPDALMIEIFEFDTTYRIFHSPKFREELGAAWLNHTHRKCKAIITRYISDLIDEDLNIEWSNEFGYIGSNEDIIDNMFMKRYNTIADFEVYLHPAENEIIYYKILPIGTIKKWKRNFFHKPYNFDGFVCHTNMSDYLEEHDEKYTLLSLMNLGCQLPDPVSECGDLCMWF